MLQNTTHTLNNCGSRSSGANDARKKLLKRARGAAALFSACARARITAARTPLAEATRSAETRIAVLEGELLQLERIGKIDISEADYMELVDRKTASLFSACARIESCSDKASVSYVSAIRLDFFGK